MKYSCEITRSVLSAIYKALGHSFCPGVKGGLEPLTMGQFNFKVILRFQIMALAIPIAAPWSRPRAAIVRARSRSPWCTGCKGCCTTTLAPLAGKRKKINLKKRLFFYFVVNRYNKILSINGQLISQRFIIKFFQNSGHILYK